MFMLREVPFSGGRLAPLGWVWVRCRHISELAGAGSEAHHAAHGQRVEKRSIICRNHGIRKTPGSGLLAFLYGKHADHLERFDDAPKVSYDTTVESRVQDKLTAFTASDFGRALTSIKGSDHGWRGHHFFFDTAVRDGRRCGNFDNLQAGNSNPSHAARGHLIPACSPDQHAATRGNRLGAPPADVAGMLPNLINFSGQSDLGLTL